MKNNSTSVERTLVYVLFLLIFNNNSFAQFGALEHLTPGFTEVRDFDAADINGDGKLDVLSYSRNTHNIVYFKNEGSSLSFTDYTIIHEFDNLYDLYSCVEPYDIDQDGDIDIIVCIQNKQGIYWLENIDGEGSFDVLKLLAETEEYGNLSSNVWLGDLNGDNDIDIIGRLDSRYYKFENNGLNEFNEGIRVFDSFHEPNFLSVFDIDNDSDMDIIGNKGELYRNEGGLFIEEGDVLEFGQDNLIFGDINSDGYNDICYIDRLLGTSSGIYWKPNLGNGEFGDSVFVLDEYNVYGLQLFDLDSDGDLDLTFYESVSKLNVFENTDGLGDYTLSKQVPYDMELNNDNEKLIIGQFNEDDYYDFMFTGSIHYSPLVDDIFILNGSEEPENYSVDTVFLSSASYVYDIGFANDDEFLDILYHNKIFYGTNSGDYTEVDLIHHIEDLSSSYMDCFRILNDVNGDGLMDIVVHNDQNHQIYWFENQGGTNNYDSPKIILTGISDFNINIYDDMVFQDFDGNNTLDLAIIKPSDGLYLFYDINSASPKVFDEPDSYFPYDNLRTYCISDYDNDGDQDIIIEEGSVLVGVGSSYHLRAIENNGLDGFSYSEDYNLNDFVDFIELVDLNADTYKDLVVFSNDGAFVQFNIDGSFDFEEPLFITDIDGIFTDVELADLDNDNQMDIIISGGSLQVINGATLAIEVIDDSNCNCKVADMDNDGDLDLVKGFDNIYGVYPNYKNDPRISGTVYFDENQNGQRDSLELGFGGQKVELNPNGLSQWGDSEGYYEYVVASGSYELLAEIDEQWIHTTDSMYNLMVDADSDTISIDFGIVPNVDSIYSETYLNSAPTRCGFTVPFWLSYTSISDQIENGLVELRLDTLVSYISAEPEPDYISDSLLVWNVTDVFPLQDNQINLLFEIADADNIGSTINLQSTFNILDDTLGLTAEAKYDFASVINCAYDPNDKQVEPSFEDFENYTLFGEELKYTIRFQNTGTDTAFNIFIKDQLDENLDWESFELIASSHNMRRTIDEYGELTFFFDDILLPSMETNEPLSHGFVTYSIQPKANMEEETYVFNTAAIYFDYNAPIITNTVKNIYVSGFPIVESVELPSCTSGDDGSIRILLPDSDFTTMEWSNGATGPVNENLSTGYYSVSVYDPNDDLLNTATFFVPEPAPFNSYTSITPSNGTTSLGSANILLSGGTGDYETQFSYPDSLSIGLDPDALYPGAHVLYITDSNACSDSISFEIPIDFESFSSYSEPLCHGLATGSIQYEDELGILTYDWNTGASGPFLENLAVGEYVVTIKETVSQDTLSVDVFNITSPEPISYESDINSSNGSSELGSVSLSPSGGISPYVIEWATNPIQEGEYIDGLNQGTYTFSILDHNDCLLIDSVEVPLDYVFQATAQSPLCEDTNDGYIEVQSVSSNLNYEWSTGSTSAELQNLGNGTYSLTVSDAENNYLMDTSFTFNVTALEIEIFEDDIFPFQDFTSAQVIVNGGTPPYNFTWNTSPPETDSIATIIESGIYSVIVEDDNGCEISAQIEITIAVSAKDIDLASMGLQVYPNPSDGLVNIEFDALGEKEWQLGVFNNLGQKIADFNRADVAGEKVLLHLDGLSSGPYLLVLNVDDKLVNQVFIVH